MMLIPEQETCQLMLRLFLTVSPLPMEMQMQEILLMIAVEDLRITAEIQRSAILYSETILLLTMVPDVSAM
ncbi:hypothetical protein SDC9_125794 [bioreactor metagenome]|uniref:Uncharacterized protein n=1 Tax=bioreactor metagenome TaxID=1076179 RepID=A0A645CPD9_9ZZZZ